MHCNKVLFQELIDNDLRNTLKNNAWNLNINVEKLQEVLNRTMQIIVVVITSALEAYIQGG